MWGCRIFNAGQMALLLEEIATSNPTCMSKLDIFSYIISSAELTVMAEIFRVFAQFDIALPLVLPNMRENSPPYSLLCPALYRCLVRWESEIGTISNYLFRSPYKMITCIRLGSSDIGKSTILNQIFDKKDIFYHRHQTDVIPLSQPGSVELFWLTRQTCNEVVWKAIESTIREDELILLSNLHGDALKYLNVLEAITSVTSSFIVFVMPDALKTFEAHKEGLLASSEQKHLSFLFVGQSEPHSNSLEVINSQPSIKNSRLLQKTLTSCIVNGPQLSHKNYAYPTSFQADQSTPVNIVGEFKTPESSSFLELISVHGKKLSAEGESIRNILRLQSENSSNKHRHKISWDQGTVLQEIMNEFANIFKLPLEQRRVSLAHIETELEILSAEQLQHCEKEYMALKKKLSITDDPRKSQILNNQVSILQTECSNLICIDDYIRELGKVYDMLVCFESEDVISSSPFSNLPESYAELFLEGRTLEILDGSLAPIHGNWLESVCHSVCEKHLDLRVFVVSILGLQSSGKSTLLNALFGCKFPVSVGRCTRGIFMRLMFLEESYRKELQVDAILIIDTEGLGSPDNGTDPDAEVKDRMMATFAMTVSNLTIINVFGDNQSAIVNCLQIVILTMARLETAEISPDILVVQHVSEGGASVKLKKGIQQFCAALEDAVNIIDRRELHLGIRNCKNLKNLRERIVSNNIVVHIRPLKSGGSPQSEPTEEYHEDVVQLHCVIMQQCKENAENRIKFCNWHRLLKSYWNAVKKEDFPLRFLNIRQVQEFIEVNELISVLKKDLDAAFRKHKKALKLYITKKLDNFPSSDMDNSNFEKQINISVEDHIHTIPQGCVSVWTAKDDNSGELSQSSCDWCAKAENKRREIIEFVKKRTSVDIKTTEQTIIEYTDHLRKSAKWKTMQIYEAGKIQLGKATEFENILREILNSKTVQLRTANSIWEQLVSEVSEKYPIKSAREQVVDDILNVYSVHNIENSSVNWKTVLLGEDHSPILEKLGYWKSKTSYVLLKNDRKNWLDRQFQEISEKLITAGKEMQQIIEIHKEKAFHKMRVFEKKFKIKIDSDSHWKAILYANELIVPHMIQIQKAWNQENDPFFILLKQKDFYIQKILEFLEPQMTGKVGDAVSTKLMDASLALTLKAKSHDVYNLKWSIRAESVRLRYFVELAEKVKNGHTELAMQHFENPQAVMSSWFIETIETNLRDTVLPATKMDFREECLALGKEILKTNTLTELKQFISWYLAKVGVIFAEEVITSKMLLDDVKAAILQSLETNVDNYCGKILLESLNLDYNIFLNNLGCTATCPDCAAICWAEKGHENNLVRFRNHFTCHQPQGLAGFVNAEGQLSTISCYDKEKEKSMDERVRDHDEVSWIIKKHPVNEFILLMQWFFWKLNGKLAEHFDSSPAPHCSLSKMGLNGIDEKIDEILSICKYRSDM